MAEDENWVDIGHAEDFSENPLKRVKAMDIELAISCKDGKLGAVSNTCNHVGGPLGEGRLDGDYIICPWHNWKFHRCSGAGEPGFEDDCVPGYPIKVEDGRVFVNLDAGSKRNRKPACSPPPVTKSRTCVRAAAASGNFHFGHGRRKPSLLGLGPLARTRIESGSRSRCRDEND